MNLFSISTPWINKIKNFFPDFRYQRFFLIAPFIIIGAFFILASWATKFLADDLRYLYEIEQGQFHANHWLYLISTFGGTFQWRPLVNLSWLIDYQIAGYHEFWYHLVNLAVFFASAALIYSIVKKISGRTIAWITAWLFFILPYHYEVVLWISGRTDGFSFLFLLLSVFLFLEYKDRNKLWYLAGSLLAYATGLLSKELAIVTPGIILMLDLAYPEFPKQIKSFLTKKFFVVYGGFFLVTIGYLGARWFVFKNLVGSSDFAQNTMHWFPSIRDLLVLNSRLSYIFNFDALAAISPTFFQLWSRIHSFLIPAMVIVLGLLTLKFIKDKKYLRDIVLPILFLFMLGWAVFWLLPNITPALMHSRFLYAPSFALSWLIAALCVYSLKQNLMRRIIGIIILAITIGLSATALAINYLPWQTASQRMAAPLDDLSARYPELVYNKKLNNLWVHGVKGEFQGAYMYHDYFSFNEAFHIRFPASRSSITVVGNARASNMAFCNDKLDNTTILRWNQDHFETEESIKEDWLEAPKNESIILSSLQQFISNGWSAQDISVEEKNGILTLYNFGKHPALNFSLPKPLAAGAFHTLSWDITTSDGTNIPFRISFTASNEHTLIKNSFIELTSKKNQALLCLYPNWIATQTINSISLSFPAYYKNTITINYIKLEK